MRQAVRVRPATRADAPALARLRYEFRAALGPPVEPRERFVRRCTAWMRRRLAPGSRWRCWVAERDGAVVGSVWVQLVEKIPNPVRERERHAYLTSLYVRAAARGGTGARLLAAALAWCRRRAVDTVVLWPTARSRSLYARHGFRPPRAILARPAE